MEKGFIYLASASPRRQQLLRQIGVEFVARPADVEETKLPSEPASAYVSRIAAAKADAVWSAVAQRPRPVLAADTAVVVSGAVFGKPADEEMAMDMLGRLSGRAHAVYTAVVVRYGERRDGVVNSSEVRFRSTTTAERRAYCASGEPFDKAGGYAIQGLGAVFVEQLSGSYSSVMGLPLFETAALLKRFGVPAWLEGPGRQA
jgi:septum formation protein